VIKPNSFDNYSEKKILYLEQLGFKDRLNIKQRISGRMTPDLIEKSLANTLQLVFEVTEECNLNCEYCAYHDIYKGKFDARKGTKLDFQLGINLLKFLFKLWESNKNLSYNKKVYISFYGGEPLLNMGFIKKIVKFINISSVQNISFKYSMTTNALLLKKNISFLVDNDFSILISLDGNRDNNRYRVYKNKKEAFDQIIDNVDYVYQNYLQYFKENVNFNAVLHNHNSVNDIFNFIYKKYNKQPKISELNTSNINISKTNDFVQKYQNMSDSLNQSEDYRFIRDKLFVESPDIKSLADFIHTFTKNVYSSYTDFFEHLTDKPSLPTGTCIPFSRKIFLTAQGKLLPCETIPHNFSMGYVDKKEVILDYGNISKTVNHHYNKISRLCNLCQNFIRCKQCIYNLEIESTKPHCHGFIPDNRLNSIFPTYLNMLSKNRKLYSKILSKVYYE
jgi:uncharacterized protein